MGFFSRRKGGADPLTEFREPTLAAGEPDITGRLQQLDVPFQRKGEAWLVEVGGAWATFAWIPRDATLAGWLDYAERPAASTELVRAQNDTGLAAYEVTDGALMSKVSLPAEHVDATGLRLAVATLAREAGGDEAPAQPDTGDAGVGAALGELGTDPGEAQVLQRRARPGAHRARARRAGGGDGGVDARAERHLGLAAGARRRRHAVVGLCDPGTAGHGGRARVGARGRAHARRPLPVGDVGSGITVAGQQR